MSEELPEGWVATTLGGGLVANIQTGFACGKHSRDSRGVAHLRPMNVSEAGSIVLEDVKYIESSEVDRDERWVCDGDVVFNNTNSPELVGKTALYTLSEPRAFSNHMTRLRCSSAVQPSYCALLLHYRWQQGHFLAKCNNHVSQASVGRELLLATEVPLPPQLEQRRIVTQVEALLGQVNRAKMRLDRVPLILKRFRQAILAAACSGELTPELDSSTWDVRTLGDVLDGFESGRNLKCEGRSARAGELGVLKISAVTWGTFRPGENKALLPGDEPRPHERVRAGDLLITRANTAELVGAVALVDRDYPQLMLPDKILRLRLKTKLVEARYLLHALRSQGVRNHFEAEATGTSDSMRNLSQPKLAAAPIVVPPLSDQLVVAARIEALLTIADAIDRRVKGATARADKLPQAVLSKAFSGELVPTEAELARAEGRTYETAAELLERVGARSKSQEKKASSRGRKRAGVEA